MKWEKCILSLISILENPHIEAGYRDLKRYYELNKLKYEADCIQFLIDKKFNVNNTNINKK